LNVIALEPGTTNVRLSERPKPRITQPNDVLLQVIAVGICGTDRDEASGGRSDAPAGEKELVIGHEMIGRVVEAGPGARGVAIGALGAFTVRRPCDHCQPCALGRPDWCTSGDYTERGIKGRDGYNAEFVVDEAEHFVPIPDEIQAFGVLAEPMSIAQKAITEAVRIQASRLPGAHERDPWLSDRTALVAGLGPVGLLAAIELRLRGARVLGLDVIDGSSPRARLLAAVGGTYVDGREKGMPRNLAEHHRHIDFIFEATGVAHLEFDLFGALAPNGLYVLTGIPEGTRPIEVAAATLVRRFVLENQLMLGSVNASREHWVAGIASLGAANKRWPGVMPKLITRRVPASDIGDSLASHDLNEIKTVIHWADA